MRQSVQAAERRVRGHAIPKFTFGEPTDDWELYLEGVISGRVRVLQIDRCTWLAELIDLDEEILLVK